MVSTNPMNHEGHPECECCQAGEIDEVAVLREHNRILGLGLAELARALGAQRRENARLEAAKDQLAAEVKTAYGKIRKLTEERAWARLEKPFEPGPAVALLWDSVRRRAGAKRAAKEVA